MQNDTGSYILATGGAGYVGSHTVVELLKAGYKVIVIDNLANANMESVRRVEELTGKEVPSYAVDLLNADALRNVFEKHNISCVIHFAGYKAVGESCEKPLLYYKNNVAGTVNLLQIMKEFKVFNMIFSSSTTVYGVPEYLPFDENHKTGNCSNPYGRSKFMIEEIMKDLSTAEKEWNIILLRYFNPVGAHESGKIGEDPLGTPRNLLPYVAQVAVGKLKELKIYGNDWDTPDGTCLRDYIHVVDLAKGHVSALRLIETNCGLKIYNLGTGTPFSVLDIVHAFEKASGKKIPYEFVERRAGDLASTYCERSLAAAELGWTAQYGLDKICVDMWKWQSENPSGYTKTKQV